ncbi:hypothetical protein UY3_01740 [Chelonia mydas]|uniref:Uncharacterized protein n=1 Tax=Chelonia mydas TaxID=8469 RepID=M7BUQ6_CHEMY|nr:hypothetical protein UY3_01740 [Chelonia mydas]
MVSEALAAMTVVAPWVEPPRTVFFHWQPTMAFHWAYQASAVPSTPCWSFHYRCCCNRRSRGRFSKSSEDPLNRWQSALRLTPVLQLPKKIKLILYPDPASIQVDGKNPLDCSDRKNRAYKSYQTSNQCEGYD